MVFPEKGYKGNNKALDYVWNKIAEYDTDEVFAVHGAQVADKNVDCIFICPDRLAIVVAVKDYLPENIKTVNSDRRIVFDNRPSEYAGADVVLMWRQEVVKMLQGSGINSDLISISVCYPFVDAQSFDDKEMKLITPRELTFLADDFESEEVFIKKIDDVYKYVAKSLHVELSGFSLNHENVYKLGELLIPGFGNILTSSKNRTATEVPVDLNANSSKELFYGICSFLMRNGITQGYVYSKSSELLDALGDYMSDIKIPWSYYTDATKKGYVFVDSDVPKEEKNNGVIIDLNDDSHINVIQGRDRVFRIVVHDRNAIYKDLHVREEQVPLHLKNEQIRKMFLKSFVLAQKEIDIISPWMNFGVVNDHFVELMEDALARGVRICIIYGLNPDSSEYNLSRSNRSDQVAKYLRDRFSKYGEMLSIVRDNIHYKLVLCDDLFKLEGGYNYLSFVGDYENEDTRKEGSPYGTQVEEIRYLRKEYFGHE